MSADIINLPSPSQWVDRKLRELKLSNSGLARIMGQDRTQVQRWINGREQIPRHHLAEIAAQLGDEKDLDYALKLKECEDFADILKRRLRELARVGRFDVAVAESAVFGLLEERTDEEECSSPSEYASALLYNITHASFIFRLWQEAATSRDFTKILTPQNLKLHVQYPANHFLGLALTVKTPGGRMPEFQDQCLTQLRSLARSRCEDSPMQLSHHHHAIHILGRFGDTDDQAAISEIMEDAAASTQPISIRLGYAGLTLRPGYEGLADKYIWLLEHDSVLSAVDIAFDAVHYGDANLTHRQTLPIDLAQANKTVTNLLRRLSKPEQYAEIRELDTYRLSIVLSRLPPSDWIDPVLSARIRMMLKHNLASDTNKYTAEATSRMVKLLKKN